MCFCRLCIRFIGFSAVILPLKLPLMPKDIEFGPRARILQLLRAIVDQPGRYTKKELAARFVMSDDTISDDFEIMANAGFVLERDQKGRYQFVVEKPFKKLQDLLHFSKEDQVLLHQAIDQIPTTTERQAQLKAKLSSLYDFRQLGHAYLRKPYLGKVDLLLQAQSEKKQVLLEGYRSSNSSTVSDRNVEAFHIAPSEDMLHAFDLEKRAVRHFRISRFTRVQILDAPWQHEGHHNIMLTDPFRIVGNEQVMVHLRLSVGAYNELTERYPLTKGSIEPTRDTNIYDFQARVNSQFLGLSNFILGFYHLDIDIVAPDALREHLKIEVERMRL